MRGSVTGVVFGPNSATLYTFTAHPGELFLIPKNVMFTLVLEPSEDPLTVGGVDNENQVQVACYAFGQKKRPLLISFTCTSYMTKTGCLRYSKIKVKFANIKIIINVEIFVAKFMLMLPVAPVTIR
jgi:hypothetical protein